MQARMLPLNVVVVILSAPYKHDKQDAQYYSLVHEWIPAGYSVISVLWRILNFDLDLY